MNKCLLINLSPRREGTSMTLLNACKEYLEAKGCETSAAHLYPAIKDPSVLFEAVKAADTLVFIGPCYINTYPADTVWLLQELAAQPALLHGQNVYGMIQGGMPYTHTHACGLCLLERFCAQCGLAYRGGFVMGMGAMLNGQPLSRLINAKKVLRQLDVFFGHVEKGEASAPSVYEAAQLKLPLFVFRLMARMVNRKIDKDLMEHGIDPYQPSAYL